MENIAGYVYDHTLHEPRRWHQLEANQRGPYFVSMVHSPRRAEFLRFVRLHVEDHPYCDPLDGRVHRLEEVTRWIGIRALAVRFISLGVGLGVFELVQPKMRREQDSHEDTIIQREQENEVRFRSKGDLVASISSSSAGVVSRSGGAKNRAPIIIAFSSASGGASVPSVVFQPKWHIG